MPVYFRQIVNPDLGCASYLIADRGEAAVIDPQWEIQAYLEAAAQAGAEIVHVLETHTHADHVSGWRRLAEATGATAHAPCGRGREPVTDGDVVWVGAEELIALATPGHRPEHVSYLVREWGAAARLLSGESLLIGDVARPDFGLDAAEGARWMWSTLQRLLALDDDVEVWPGHVDCAVRAVPAAASVTFTTIGAERRSSPLPSLPDARSFTEALVPYPSLPRGRAERVMALNLRGASDPGPVGELDAGSLAQVVGHGICLLDVRDAKSFREAHLDGAVRLSSDTEALGLRAAWTLGCEEPIVLIAPSLEAGRSAIELLLAAGVWNLGAVSVADPAGWQAAGLAVRTDMALSAEIRRESRHDSAHPEDGGRSDPGAGPERLARAVG